MTEYWESKFQSEGVLWEFYPADSAIRTIDIFKTNRFKNILIPGFGYGRNARLFIDNGFDVTGIEISKSAIDLAKTNGIECMVHHGSVTTMPFDSRKYDGIFCYALIHLLNKNERKAFLRSCYNQLKNNGQMIFVVASTEMSIYGTGRYLSKSRFEISKGLKVYFYDYGSVFNEFSPYGIAEITEIEEPVKFMTEQDPIKMIFIACKKKIY